MARTTFQRAWLLILGILSLALLVNLHKWADGKEKKSVSVDEAISYFARSVKPSSAATPEGSIVRALGQIRTRGVTSFASIDDLYAAIDRSLTVSLPKDATQSVHSVEESDFSAWLDASKTLAATETGAWDDKANDTARQTSLARRQRLNQIYLARAEALEAYDRFRREEVRRAYYAAAPKIIEPKATSGVVGQIIDHTNPLHLVYDLLWYAALVTTVICFATFIVAAFLAVMHVPGITEAFDEKKKKLLDFAEGGAAIAAAATVAVVGAGTIAGTVGSASTSPWAHTHFTAASALTPDNPLRGGVLARTEVPSAPSSEGGKDRNSPFRIEETGRVMHEVEIKPITLDMSKLDRIVNLHPTPIVFAVPSDWEGRIYTAENKSEKAIEQAEAANALAEKTNGSLPNVVDAKLVGVKKDVLNGETFQVSAIQAAGMTQRGLFAFLPWFRDFHVGDFEIDAVRKSPEFKDRESDRQAVIAALNSMRNHPADFVNDSPEKATADLGVRYSYNEFIRAYRAALAATAPHESRVALDSLSGRTLDTVMAICRIPR